MDGLCHEMKRSMLHSTVIKLSGLSDVGKVRQLNEDRILMSPAIKSEIWISSTDEAGSSNPIEVDEWGSLMMIADGMGGAKAGEEASNIATQRIQQFFSSISDIPNDEASIHQKLKDAILGAHYQIIEHVAKHPQLEGMGTTIIIAWIIGDMAYFGWIGDSRAYLFRPEEGFFLLTDDHSLVWEEVKRGNLSPEQARLHPNSNIITQALGDPQQIPSPEFRDLKILPNDCILLCSDGLNGMVPDEEIANILTLPITLCERSTLLINTANEAGGGDNVSVGIIEIESIHSPSASNAEHEEEENSDYQDSSGKFFKSWMFILASLIILGFVIFLFWFT